MIYISQTLTAYKDEDDDDNDNNMTIVFILEPPGKFLASAEILC